METTTLKQSDSINSWPSITYEFRVAKLRAGPPCMLESPDRQYVYRSLYGYGPDTTRSINSRQNTRDLGGVACFSDTLIIDCDTTSEADQVRERLGRLVIGYSEWDTGNRGCHFHIPIEPMYGPDTIWSQRCWLQDIGVWEIVDRSIYREGGQIRLPGATHEKTGRVKTLIDMHVGKKPVLPLMKSPPVPQRSSVVEEGSPEARNEYHRNLLYRRGEGERHTHLFILWKRGREAGLDPESIYDDLRWWNERMAVPPHTTSMIENKLRGFR